MGSRWMEHRSPLRSQACRAVRLRVTPLLSSVTGSVMRHLEMGQKNSRGGAQGPAYEWRRRCCGVTSKCLRLRWKLFLHSPDTSPCKQLPISAYQTSFGAAWCRAQGPELSGPDKMCALQAWQQGAHRDVGRSSVMRSSRSSRLRLPPLPDPCRHMVGWAPRARLRRRARRRRPAQNQSCNLSHRMSAMPDHVRLEAALGSVQMVDAS